MKPRSLCENESAKKTVELKVWPLFRIYTVRLLLSMAIDQQII